MLPSLISVTFCLVCVLCSICTGGGSTAYYLHNQKKLVPNSYECIDPVTDKSMIYWPVTDKEKEMTSLKRQSDYLWDCNNLYAPCVFAKQGCIVKPYYQGVSLANQNSSLL